MKKMVVFLLVAGLFLSMGCEPLRKKFVRKKKAKDQQEMVPILEPQPYPDNAETAAARYQHHYMLWTIWQRELLTVLNEENFSEKKVKDLLSRMGNHFAEMEPFITGEKHDLLIAYQAQVVDLQSDFAQPAAIRNKDILKKRVGLLGKNVRRDLNSQAVEESIKE